jgi:hypothetical protein
MTIILAVFSIRWWEAAKGSLVAETVVIVPPLLISFAGRLLDVLEA